MKEETVIITKKEYESLLKDSEKLSTLEKMKKSKTQWEEITEYIAYAECPYCKSMQDVYGFSRNVNEGDWFKGKVTCPKCSKNFMLEIEAFYDV